MRRSKLIVLAVTVCGLAVAAAALASNAKVTRCGVTKAFYGRSGVYPFKLSCAEAKRLIAASESPRTPETDLTAPPGDAGVLKIDGRDWVCGGQMDSYFCGYPYRPEKTADGTGYRGPFTKGVAWLTCASAGGCPRTTIFYQPSS